MFNNDQILSLLQKKKSVVLKNNYYDNWYQQSKYSNNNYQSSNTTVQDQLVQDLYTEFLKTDISLSSEPILQNGVQKNMILQLKDTVDTTHSLFGLINDLKKGVPIKRGNLKWLLTDGKYDIYVYEMIPNHSINIMTPFGSKFLVSDGIYANGILLVKPENIKYLGGSIPTFNTNTMEKELIKRFEERLTLTANIENSNIISDRNPEPINQHTPIINTLASQNRVATATHISTNNKNNNSNYMDGFRLRTEDIDEFDNDLTMEDIDTIEQLESQTERPDLIEILDDDDEFPIDEDAYSIDGNYAYPIDDYSNPIDNDDGSSQVSQQLEKMGLGYEDTIASNNNNIKNIANDNDASVIDSNLDCDTAVNGFTCNDDYNNNTSSIGKSTNASTNQNTSNNSRPTSSLKEYKHLASNTPVNNHVSAENDNKTIDNNNNNNIPSLYTSANNRLINKDSCTSISSNTTKSTTPTIIKEEHYPHDIRNEIIDLDMEDYSSMSDAVTKIITVTELKKLLDDLKNNIDISDDKCIHTVVVNGLRPTAISSLVGYFDITCELLHDEKCGPIFISLTNKELGLDLFPKKLQIEYETPEGYNKAMKRAMRPLAFKLRETKAELDIDLSIIRVDNKNEYIAKGTRYLAING
ncbi:hypothetical protein BJ944DRAFT_272825 [Cunninghamella echinulata]|nr:hypothetical protein BJ944DRAFT_272825 [Cunninghamella echinulata]